MFRFMLFVPLIMCTALFAQSPTITPEPKTPGNVFTLGEAVEIPVASKSSTVRYTITNLWGEVVGSGETPVTNGVATITPDARKPGYFEVDLSDPANPAAKGRTSYAVITPVDITKMPNNPFGVMTHFAQYMSPDILPLIAKAGIGTIRDEAYWAAVEKKAGDFVPVEKFDTYMKEAKKQNIDVIMVMSFENKLYDNGETPFTPKARQAYADYGAFLLKHYGDQIKTLEVWNEYNGTWCKGAAAKDRPTSYAGMIKPVYETIKATRPDVKVLGGAAVLLPPPYFEGIFKAGGLASMDAVVIHPYRGQPEGVEVEVAALQQMIRTYNNGKDKPIWVTETGRMDASPNGRHNIASYLVRQYTLLLSVNCEKICWYLVRDYMNFKTMGLLRDPKDPMGAYTPAPAYVTYSNLIRQLYGTTFEKRETSDPRTRIYTFANAKEQVRVCWATVPTHVALAAGGPVLVTDMSGESFELSPVDGQILLTLDTDPVFVKASKGTVAGLVEKPLLGVAAEQRVDLLSSAKVRFTLRNPTAGALQGTLSMFGKDFPVRVEVGASAEVFASTSDIDTSAPSDRSARYTLRLNNQAVARGRVHIEVGDPLRVTGASLISASALEVRLANGSVSTGYEVESIGCKLGVRDESKPLAATIGPGEQLVVTIPVDKVTPYKDLAFEAKIGLKQRAAVVYRGSLSYNPVAERTIGGPGDWKDVPAIELAPRKAGKGPPADPPRAFLAADKERVYISAIAPANQMTFALAGAKWSPENPRAGYYEFVVGAEERAAVTISPPDAAKPEFAVKAKRDGGSITWEVAVPWSSLKGISPEDGAFRFALAADDLAKAPAPLTFGGGILRGKSPGDMALCVLGTPKQAAGEIRVVREKYVAGDKAVVLGKVVADSSEDFSNEQNGSGWSYGYFAGDAKAGEVGPGKAPSGPYTDSDFRPMEYVQTVWGYEWAAAGFRNLKLSREGGHPAAGNGRAVWAVRRWRSPVDGTVRIAGVVNRGDTKGDGTEARILVGGVVVYSRLLSGKESVGYEVRVRVEKGTLVDFVLTPGPGGDTSYDAAGFEARVTEVGG